jgi:hypothetical protein
MLDSIKTDNWISEFEEDAIWDPYYANGIIAIDGCTAHTGKVNVLVLEDEFIDEKANIRTMGECTTGYGP